MADTTVLDYIAGSFRAKSNATSSLQGARALSRAAAELHFLHAAGPIAEDLKDLVARALGLAQSKSNASKLAGFNALAVFAAEASMGVFLAGYLGWAAEGVTAIKASGQEQGHSDVSQAAWRMLAAIFKRVGSLVQVPGVRRDAATLAPKLVALVLHPSADAEPGECALHALYAALEALPAPFKSHTTQIEALLAAAMFSSEGAVAVAAADCFAALPRRTGDATTWSATAQRLLATAHALLDDVYLSLEPEGLVDACKRSIDPSAAPLAPPSAAPGGALAAYTATFTHLRTVIGSLVTLLTAAYPSPVPVPSHGLLMLVTRGLAVDATSTSGPAAASGGKLAELCLHLPEMHAVMLRLLRTTLTAAGTQMLPLLGAVGRLLEQQLAKIAAELGGGEPLGADTPPPSVRCALYTAVEALLQSGSWSSTRLLAPTLRKCASAELYGKAGGAGKGAGRSAGAQPPQKKAKRAKHGAENEGLLGIHDDNVGSASERANLRSQAGVLHAVAALLTCGAALLSPARRHQIDDVAAHAACMATEAAGVAAQDVDGDASGLVPLQLAAYKALLASVLAPAPHRPPHLALALQLFQQSLRHQDIKLSAFCTNVSL